jgi:hypothetical protein
VQQPEARGVVDIDLIAREPSDRQHLAVGAILQLIRIADRDTALYIAGARVQQEQRIGRRVAHHQRFAVRRQHQMVRLPQQGDRLGDLVRGEVDHVDRRVVGIDHEDGVGLRAAGQHDQQACRQLQAQPAGARQWCGHGRASWR